MYTLACIYCWQPHTSIPKPENLSCLVSHEDVLVIHCKLQCYTSFRDLSACSENEQFTDRYTTQMDNLWTENSPYIYL